MNLIRRLMSGVVLALAINIGSAYANTDNHDVYADDDSVLESYNRAMFSFNNYFNHYVFMPTAQAYRDITTPFVRKRVSNIFDNLQEPVSSGNYLLQAEPKGALISLSRFVINSTLGLLGMFDVAEGWGLSQKTIGFDDTFAKWCIPDGPYIVLPLLGPSTPRSAISMGLNFVFDPVYWGTVNDANIHDKATYSLAIAYGVVVMEQNMDLLKDLERSSVDYYAAMKATYMQNRKNKGCFKNDSSANDYDFDFGIEE